MREREGGRYGERERERENCPRATMIDIRFRDTYPEPYFLLLSREVYTEPVLNSKPQTKGSAQDGEARLTAFLD